MTNTELDLARRLVSHPKWRWTASPIQHGIPDPDADIALPDLRDPVIVGHLLHSIDPEWIGVAAARCWLDKHETRSLSYTERALLAVQAFGSRGAAKVAADHWRYLMVELSAIGARIRVGESELQARNASARDAAMLAIAIATPRLYDGDD